MKIKDFLIEHCLREKKKKLFIKDKLIKEVKSNIDIILGYKFIKKNQNFGEYVELNFNNGIVTIKNDDFGTYPVYIYKSKNKILISTCLSWLIKKNNKILHVDSRQLYIYFGWGYIPASNKTLYKGITTLEPRETLILNKILKIKKDKLQLFKDFKSNFKISEFLKLIKIKIFEIFNKYNFKKSYLGLTAGHDSLLGSLLINNSGFNVTTSTYGQIDSEEIKRANYRGLRYFHKKNINIYYHQIIPSDEEVIKISKLLGGLNTIASFPQYKFHKILSAKNKKIFFDFSMFEFLRKKKLPIKKILMKYTTPKHVVENFFINKMLYNNLINFSSNNILKKYKKKYFHFFYILDRAAKNQLNKALYLKDLGMIKIALGHDRDILNFNYNYVKKKKILPFWKLLKNCNLLLSDFYKEKAYLKNLHTKHLALDYKKLCYRYENLFNKILNEKKIIKFQQYFDINLIKKKINEKTINEGEEWFILRIMNFFIFLVHHKIKIK
jgi:hypothetical protein